MKKKMLLLPCDCSGCEHSDTNDCGIVCMILYPQFAENGNCLDFKPMEGGACDED